MRTTAKMLLVLALAGLPAGCVLAEPWGAPAIVTNPTAASRAALERAVSQALTHGAPVRLAPDALTHQSLLIVGHAQARDARGIPLNGRELERPQHFRLLRRGSKCVLLHVETGKLSLLAHTTCRPILSDSVRR